MDCCSTVLEFLYFSLHSRMQFISQSRLVTALLVCASFPIKVKPVQIARERRRGVVVNSFGAASSVDDETPVKDTGVKEMVDANITLEISELELQEAADKYYRRDYR